MPRPPVRRRQQNQNGPFPRVSSYKQIPSNSPAKAELSKKLANKPVGARPTDSDDSDRLVVRGNGRRGRYAPKQEIYASGAVGKGDQPGSHPTRAQRREDSPDATRDVLVDGQQAVPKGKTAVTAKDSKAHVQSKENPTLVNGVIAKAPTARKDTAPPSTVTSSVVKPPGSVVRPVLPTPTRENSILGTLKPRRRQPSILQNLDHDSSSFDLEDEEDFLPDDESTPVHQSKPQPSVSTTNRTTPLLSSSSRKRKLGSLGPLDPAESESIEKLISSPVTTMQRPRHSPDPPLPAMPVSVLRESGRKHRESLQNEDDVMALPRSSSSPAPFPPKAKTPASKEKPRRRVEGATLVTTKDLLEAAMPAKHRRKIRERTRNRGSFDIPADSDLEQDREEDSSFLPSGKGRKTRRKEPLSKSSNARTKATTKSKASQKGKKPKSSTIHFTTISTSAPILAPSTASNRETKSPSQQRSTTDTSSTTNLAGARGGQKRYGGSHRQRAGSLEKASDQENQISRKSGTELPESSGDRDVDSEFEDVGMMGPANKSRWADIDAWDMEFEDVEVMTGSSSPTRR